MADPSDTNTWQQISGVLILVLGWFWALLSGNRKKLDELKDQVNSHEKRVASEYPTRNQMKEALDDTVVPIYKKFDEHTEILTDIKKTLDRERDEELQRLRQMAQDRRKL